MNYIIIFSLVGFGMLVLFLYLRKRKTSGIWDRVFAIKNKSNRGFTLWLEDGCAEPDAEAIKAGMTRTFVKSACRGYDRPFNFSDYIIAIVRSEPSTDGTPCYRIPAGQYAGSEYDKGGYILVAGQCLTIGEPYGNIIVIPDHKGQFTEHLSLVAEFECEHIVLANCDPDEYERTKTHGNGQGHPIIPNCDGLSEQSPIRLHHQDMFICGGHNG